MIHMASFMDIRALTYWRTLCPETDLAGSKHLNHEYNKLLLHWFEDPEGFRDVLRLTGSVISGSTALQFLHRDNPVDWTGADLDVYTPRTTALRMLHYLVNVEGYTLDNINRPSYRPDSRGFHRVYHVSNNEQSIDIIQSVTLSALHPLPFFWGSHVVTFIDADMFCLPYPDLTLSGRALLTPLALHQMEYPDLRTIRCIRKYEDRGYTVRCSHTQWPDATPCDQTHEACPRRPRYFGDELCLMGSFYPDSTPIPPTPHGLIPVWWRGGRPCDNACNAADPLSRFRMPAVHTVPLQDAIRCVYFHSCP